jgi:hypothetical protein
MTFRTWLRSLVTSKPFERGSSTASGFSVVGNPEVIWLMSEADHYVNRALGQFSGDKPTQRFVRLKDQLIQLAVRAKIKPIQFIFLG